jgi:hypothetical protein
MADNLLNSFLKSRGISPRIKRAYERLFKDNKDAVIVLEDLKHRFHYYQGSGTIESNRALRECSEREVVTYILGMAQRLKEDHTEVIGNILNKGA